MSLINDMLKDLDAQKVRNNPVNDAVLLGLGPEINTSSLVQKSLVSAVSICVVVFIGIYAWPYVTGLFTDTANNAELMVQSTVRETTDHPTLVEMPPARNLKPTRVRAENIPAMKAPEVPVKVSPLKTQPVREKPAAKRDTKSTGIVERPLSVQERVQRAYREAVLAFRNGQDARVQQLLDDALTLDSKHHESRLLLAGMYIRQQRTIEAENLLASGLAQNPGYAPFARLYAQLLIPQARYAEALHHLQTALPAATRDAEYHAILAGLYQRSGRAAEAAAQYQVALQLMPAKGEWWMGLGISQEQAGNPQHALAAYQRALQYPLDSPLQHYIKTRISILPRRQGQG